ncbi:DNA adenine methylase [Falsihalocynthiibacter sp. S25ZX9]|uniref:DNA adenine methylase n=1 Tax=Falsihalocynthiibacter sp. S25ZX9 TaxID=3240870 RepID=UPI00351024AB
MNTMTKVSAAAPVAPWLGGKKQLHKTLIKRIERLPHKTYCEPFVGMGGVFLRRILQPQCEVMNDFNGEIINLFRTLQRHYPQFLADSR